MTTTRYQTELSMPQSAAWQLLQDLSIPQHYVPGVTRTEITTATKTGVGASRLVYLLGVIPLRETVSEWQEGKGFTIDLSLKNQPLPWPVASASFRYAIDKSAQGSQIDNRLAFSMRGRYFDTFAGVISRPIVRLILWRITENMKRYYLSVRPL